VGAELPRLGRFGSVGAIRGLKRVQRGGTRPGEVWGGSGEGEKEGHGPVEMAPPTLSETPEEGAQGCACPHYQKDTVVPRQRQRQRRVGQAQQLLQVPVWKAGEQAGRWKITLPQCLNLEPSFASATAELPAAAPQMSQGGHQKGRLWQGRQKGTGGQEQGEGEEEPDAIRESNGSPVRGRARIAALRASRPAEQRRCSISGMPDRAAALQV